MYGAGGLEKSSENVRSSSNYKYYLLKGEVKENENFRQSAGNAELPYQKIQSYG